MSTKNVKRSLRTISAHGKLEAIRRVHDGESKASVARDIGVPESTLRGWCKNESKISYLSRQSSPDTDESIEPKDKRSKIEEPIQPFNLSLKSSTNIYTPSSSESLYTPMDYTKSDIDCTPKTPQNLSIKTETPSKTASQVTERERNRAELARLSVELGLNRPEMFTSNNTNSNLADLAANINLLSQWNNILMQHQLNQKKVTPDTTTTSPGSSALKPQNTIKPPKEQQSVEDYINSWLKAQESVITHNRSNGLPPVTTTTTNNTSNMQSSWFWNWYKQLTYTQQQQQQSAPPVTPEKPILYQQLTKDNNDAENLSIERTNNNNNNNKVKSVLDNLLHISNNNNVPEKKDCLSYSEALEHGEKFLKWLESCSNPSVTAMQIMQFRALLSNVKSSADRRNGDLQNKTKVKRK